jgi:iron(III) transport system substrate-binding protein
MRRPTRRAAAVLVAIATGALGLAACGSGGGADSDSVVVYSGRTEQLVQPLFDRFTEETGIEVEARYGDSGELAAQILTEGEASPADLFFSQDAGALGELDDAHQLAELPRSTLGRVPDRYRSRDGTWVGTSARVRVIAYNPDLVPEPPTSIDQVVDSEWAGQVGFAPTNASWQSFVTGLRVLRGDDGARDWLEAFAANDPVPYDNNNAVRDAVDAGEVTLGLVNHYYVWQAIAQRGEDGVTVRNQYTDPGDPGGLVNAAGVGVLGSSDHRENAARLADYLLSETGQTYFADETFEYPLVGGVPPSADLPPLDSLEPPDVALPDLHSVAETQEMLEEVGLLTR